LRIGTDCSGIEAPIVALQEMKIPFVHEFSSEIDKHCITTIKANFNPKIIFGDLTQRKLKDIPDIDMYVCGFPCQPFSIAGERHGTLDPRGTIFYECLKVIKYKKPIIFLFENVHGLLSINQGTTFKEMIRLLETIKQNKQFIYNVYWKVLNTADYGIPQSRKRVFIIGIRKDYLQKPFEWPKSIPCKPLKEFVDWNDKSKSNITKLCKLMLKNVNQKSFFINLDFKFDKHVNAHKICPTLMSRSSLYNYKLNRYANINEYLQLQGFPQNFKINVSNNQLKKQIGNSISINILIYIYKNLFKNID
jgi:DNA (cytosine-5)-methyltransferase 1